MREDDEAQVISSKKAELHIPLDDNSFNSLDEHNLSDEEAMTMRKEERTKKMLERRKNRKSTKKVAN